MDVVAPAIIDAIHDAVGIWITQLPATPERVLSALESQRSPDQATEGAA
jgi:putative selenate reductase molybdopterin-binding subunit